jgi:aminopeptidase N
MRLHSAGVAAIVTMLLPLLSHPGLASSGDCSEPYDVLHYDITTTIDLDLEVIYADTRITILSTAAGLESVALDLTTLTVDQVMAGSDTLGYFYEDPYLTVFLGQSCSIGDTLEIEVTYHGHPGNEGPEGTGGFFFEGFPKRAFQIGLDLKAAQPSMGRYWFPCRDWPCDRATAEFHITMHGINKKAICNGNLTSAVVDSTEDLVTYTWEEEHPISTHLMTVAAGRYADLPDSTCPWIHHFVYPSQVDDAAIHFQNVAAMMDAFSYRYGPYPFDRFGFVVVPQKEMYHQTCATIESSMITPDTRNEWLLANLLGNQWWGCCVSLEDWRDLWLSRSFAMYSEALFREYVDGPQAYHDYVFEDNICHVINDLGYSPLYDPLFPYERTIFEKGSCVLHMLRYVVGESLFFDALRDYRQTYEYGTATTGDFQAVVETVAGRALDWFFSEWVYDIRWPVYRYAWEARSVVGGYAVDLVIDQVQEAGPTFTMPMEILVQQASGDTLVQVWVDEAHEEFSIATGDEPTGIVLDPDRWLLMESEEVPYADVLAAPEGFQTAALEASPNPSGDVFRLRYSVPARQHMCIEIYDVRGRSVCGLLDGPVNAGTHEIVWTGLTGTGSRLAPGSYFCHLSTADGGVTRRLLLLR